MSFAGPSSIHDIQYYGDHIFTTVTAAAVVVDEWIANTMHIHKRELSELLIGLDTEWCMPTEPDGHQQVAIIQLCVGKRCLIFQLYHADDIPPSLIQFLGNKKFKFVGKGVWNDACKLFEDYELLVAHTKDVGYWAAKKYHDRDYRKLGLKALVLDLLQKVIPKPREITMSEWNAKELTIEQIEYACLDAFVSLELGIFLNKPRQEIIEYPENTPSKKIIHHTLESYRATDDCEQLDEELRQSFGEFKEDVRRMKPARQLVSQTSRRKSPETKKRMSRKADSRQELVDEMNACFSRALESLKKM
ncbi:hypothetical protein P3X46_010071 [Hevea brasiliensis]|uniref:3'-5' exonuclease domain-containing protein n=1 Tax=Hevea brasiliensis TaxID=3981 RepID=A0ABQ9MD20_HEVBR|nr:uncharacterized protein LOC131180939 [Hevea brasiliensis]KAJ9178162.1 hypothetical protein P3X46_010071 [Hevea brasiliensis]